MSTVRSPLPENARVVVGDVLQGVLVDLIDLSLLGKQLHWNVIGRSFRSVHLQLDEVVNLARTYSDQVAERAVAIGYNPDGQVATVSKRSGIDAVEPGYLADEKAISVITDRLAGVIGRVREGIAATEEPDPVSQDLLIGLTKDLEEQHWMFQAMV